MSGVSTSSGLVSLSSRSQRVADACSCLPMRALLMSARAFTVRTIDSFRVATPGNAGRRTRWMDVFLGCISTGPKVRTTRCSAHVALMLHVDRAMDGCHSARPQLALDFVPVAEAPGEARENVGHRHQVKDAG